jgi:small subunit ribosomal protein S2
MLAVRETHRLGVPVIGLVDTNADPDEANFVIPGNDDAIRSCDLVAKVIADGIAAGRSKVTTGEMTAAAAEPAAEPANTEQTDEAAPEPAAEPELEAAAVAEGSESE